MERSSLSDLPYQDILVSTRRYMHMFWQSLSIGDKIHAKSLYNSEWLAWRHPIPYLVIKELMKAASESRFFIHKIVNPIRVENGKFIIDTQEKTLKANVIIDGTGGNNILRNISSPIVRKLLEKNLISEHPCGGINIDPITYLCKNNNDKKVDNLYSIGPLNRGYLFSTNALWFNAYCAQRWAYLWALEQQ